MNDVLIKSLVEITEQKDSDSLDSCILASLSQLVQCQQIILYKNIGLDDECQLQAKVLLERQFSATQSNWQIQHLTDKNHQLSLENIPKAIQFSQQYERHLVYMPIYIQEQIVCLVEVISNQSQVHHQDVFFTLSRVYENFLHILLENEKDKLTGLYNRKTFDGKLLSLLNQQLHKQKRHKKATGNHRKTYCQDSAWLVLVDIDHFKQVNDKYGHVYGDEVLLTLAQLMQKNFRGNDLLFRFGGEEFVIVLEPMPLEQVKQTLERLQKLVADHQFPFVGQLTISCGFDQIGLNDIPINVISNADKALYYAKEHGRNCFYGYQELVEQGELELSTIEDDIELF